MSSLYEEYESYVKKYKEEYGSLCVVLYRCGQFYEIYSANDGLIDIKTISELLNIQVSRRNKSILEIDRSNTLMAGFPLFALRKFVNILVDSHYTVVIVDQVTPPPKPKRAVTEIISPGTSIENVDIHETNNLVSIYLEEDFDTKTSKYVYGIGLSIIDLSTGKSKTFECYSDVMDTFYPFDEAYRILLNHNAKEIILFGNTKNITFNDICVKLHIQNTCTHNKLNIYPQELSSISYQSLVLDKVFSKHGLISVIEYLDLERTPYALISYVYLLQFAMKHNESILNDIERPEHINKSKYCILQYNAAQQLNIISYVDQKQSLLYLLNNCVSAIGKRMFKDMLLHPIIDGKEIEKRYDIIDALLSLKRFESVRMELVKTYDIERLLRKMTIDKLHPSDFVQIHDTLNAVLKIYNEFQDMFSTHFCEYVTVIKNDIENIQNSYISTFDMEEISKYHLDNIDASFLIPGIDTNIDEQQNKLNAHKCYLNKIITCMNENNDGYFKIEYNERDGYYIIVTQKRYNEVQKHMKNKTIELDSNIIFDCKDITSSPVSASSSSLKLRHPYLQKLTDTIFAIQTKLKTYLTEFFKQFVKTFLYEYQYKLHLVSKVIGLLDVFSTHSYNAHTHRYHRPEICSKDESFVDIHEVRHPIIEIVQQDVEYITNDICLDSKKCGLLLFGLNCSGKTSFSKAIAINIIMAQSGSFVPSKMTYAPFHNIFTRIPSGDDVFKGMSTFAVEMSELRNILKRADKFSCIVGDEISHGTEVISGVSIVSAALLELSKRNCKFIFATHLHTIVNIPQISSLDSLFMKHLHVYYDSNTNSLIYDRKLKDGPGSSIYGIEVCKSLDMPKEFLDTANVIRQQQIGINTEIVNPHKSRYNTKVFIDNCKICGKQAMEVHHIKHQHLSDNDGYINNIHKNTASNLVAVCVTCHDEIHSSKITVHGYTQTSDGIKLIWERTESKSDDSITNLNAQIIELKTKGKSIANISRELDVSQYRIRKVLSSCNKNMP